MVSVPCRGAMFLNSKTINERGETSWFPSPVGELCFSIHYWLTDTFVWISFPSPVGELCFSIISWQRLSRMALVSVPCRGAMFLNRIPVSGNSRRKRVSVPCRGAMFLNGADIIVQDMPLLKFPSPVGELCFSILIDMFNISSEIVSVPCRGAMFLNKVSRRCRIWYKVSVPCRGAMFLNIYTSPKKCNILANSFRPLSGSYVSQYHPCNPASSLS